MLSLEASKGVKIKKKREKIRLTGISVLLCSDLETSFLADCSVPRATYVQKRKRQELHWGKALVYYSWNRVFHFPIQGQIQLIKLIFHYCQQWHTSQGSAGCMTRFYYWLEFVQSICSPFSVLLMIPVFIEYTFLCIFLTILFCFP